MKFSLFVVNCLALVAAVCGQYEVYFGGSIPQSGVLPINVIQQSSNVVCMNVEITSDILLKGFEYYVSYARPSSSMVTNVN